MADILLIAPLLASFFVTLFLLPFWIQKAKVIGLIWDDMNKFKSEKIAGSGGLLVVLGFIIGILMYVAYKVFYWNVHGGLLVEIFALLCVILLLAGVGLIDDLLGWQHGGLSKRSRLILTALAAIPLMAIKAGDSTLSIPFIGVVNVGILYALVLIPIGIAGATTTYNFLAGFNGLEAGQGILLLGAVGIVAYATGSAWLAYVAICMIISLLAFLVYNLSPARVFPGDVLTYTIGGLIAALSILGNFEKVAVFFFIPYIIETGLKLRGGLKKQSFGKPTPDGRLELRYPKLYGLEHVAIWSLTKMNMRATEKRVVYCIWIFQILVILLGFWIFKEGIFSVQ